MLHFNIIMLHVPSRGEGSVSYLERSPRMRKVGCSNPGRDWPKSLKQVVISPLPNARQQLGSCESHESSKMTIYIIYGVGRNTLVSIIMLHVNLLYLAGDRSMSVIVCLMAAEQNYKFNKNIVDLVYTCTVMLKEPQLNDIVSYILQG